MVVACALWARSAWAETEPEATPPVTDEQPEASYPAGEPVEITVTGERSEIGKTTLQAEEVRQMPGAFGDAFRSTEALPGVTPMQSGIPYFYIRGAPPNNNGYFVDGIRVPLLFHLALGPSVIHPGLLERLDFYPGVAPVRHGGFAGAIIAGETRRPAPVARGEANLRLVDAGALLESPFADGNGSALVAGRYGYPGPIVSAFADIDLGYWDYQTRASYALGVSDTLGLFAFGSHDYLGHDDEQDGTKVEDFVSDFHRLDLRYDHAWASGSLRVAATLGYDEQGANPTYLSDRSVAARAELEQQVAATVRLRGGLQGRLDHYGVRHQVPADPLNADLPSSAEPPRENLTPAAYADLLWRLAPRVEMVPGVRVAVFSSESARSTDDPTSVRTTVAAVDPRLSTRVTLQPGLAWLSGLGLSHQYPTLGVGELPGALVSGAGFPEGTTELQRTFQHTQGFEAALPGALLLGVTGFLSRSWGITDLTQGCLQIEPPTAPPGVVPSPDDPWYCPNSAPVTGHAHGLELLLRRSFSEKVSGLLSYTLSRSVRRAHFLTLDGGAAVATVPSDFDRTHVLNAILSVVLGRRWRAGGRFVFYTGAPYSNLAGNVPVPPYNHFRDPSFYRLDVRLEKRWLLAQGGSIAFVLEGQNVTLSKEANTLGLDCYGEAGPDGSTTRCERGLVGPITIPSVGVEAYF